MPETSYPWRAPAQRSNTARLLIACPDARGIVAAVTGFIAGHGGNLLDSEQHTDLEHGEFFMRTEFDLEGCDLNRGSFPMPIHGVPFEP